MTIKELDYFISQLSEKNEQLRKNVDSLISAQDAKSAVNVEYDRLKLEEGLKFLKEFQLQAMFYFDD